MENKKNKMPFLVFTTILISFLIFIMIIGVRSIKNNRLFSIFGYSYSVVVSESMEDTIMVNDIIFLKIVDYSTLKEEDIIVYYNDIENKNIVHRIKIINDDGTIITKGDNNPSNDSFIVTEESFLAKVVSHSKLLGLGGLINGTNKTIILIIAIIFFLYFFICSIIRIIILYKQNLIDNQRIEIEKKTEEKMRLLREEVLKELEEEKKLK